MKNKIKYLAAFTICLLMISDIFAQDVEPARSQAIRLIARPEYKLGIPPNLALLDWKFVDDNGNGILEAEENANLILEIANTGKGPAQGVVISLKDNNYDPEFKFNSTLSYPFIYNGKTIKAVFSIKAGFNIKTLEHKIDISVKEHFGYDMDPAVLTLNTIEFAEPELVFSGFEIVDIGEGTMGNPEDGRLQKGERVKMKIYVQNIGQNIAPKTTYSVKTTDANIFLTDVNGELGDLASGEVKNFWIIISPNKKVVAQGELPLYLTLKNEYDRGNLVNSQLPLVLDQKPAEIVKLDVKPDTEKLRKQVVRFEFKDKNIAANAENLINIGIVPPSITRRQNSVGIIIGVEKYDYFPPAPYAENDANTVEKYFKDLLGVEQVYTFINFDVRGYFFGDKFNPDYGQLRKAVIKGQTDVFIYYSGHGIPAKNGEKVYLLPSDGRKEAIEEQGYDLNEFYQNLNALGARSVTVFMDACFSGASRTTDTYEVQNLVAMKGALIAPQVSQPWLDNLQFTVFTSSDYNETSLGFDDAGHGLFTYYLCAGLQGKADQNADKKITMNELKDYVISNVTENSRNSVGIQTPQFHGNGEMVLAEF